MQTDNKTLLDIKDNAERQLLICWNITVLLTSLIGDSLILIGTIRYKAIKQHKVIVAVIQNMAVVDLLTIGVKNGWKFAQGWHLEAGG